MIVTNQTTADIYFGPLHLGAGIGTTLTVDDTTATSLYLTDDSVADAVNNAYNTNKITVSGQAQPFPRPTGTPQLLHGDGSPEGLVFAPEGSLFMRRDGTGPNSLYVKTTGVTLSTGWEAFGAAVGGAGTQWDFAQVTSNVTITATSEATAQTVVSGNTVTYDGTEVRIEFTIDSVQFASGTSSGTLTAVVLRDTTVLGQIQISLDHGNNTGAKDVVGTRVLYDTPSAGSHTYALSAFIVGSPGPHWTIFAGTGSSGNKLPATFRVTKA